MKRALTLVVGLLLVLLLFLAACAPKAAPAPAAPAPQAPAPMPAPVTAQVAPAKPAWEVAWENTVEAAKKEGIVVVCTMTTVWRGPLTQAFQSRYGIKPEFITLGRVAEFVAKVFAERRVGLYTTDVVARGLAGPLTELKPAGALDPLEPVLLLPEVVDPKQWYGGKLPFADSDHTGFVFLSLVQPTLVVNTNLVGPEDIKSYNDLLNPKWKGKIVINDPTTSGAGAYIGVIADSIMGWDYLRNLAKTEPILTRDQRLQLDWLSHGKAAIAVMAAPTMIIEFMRAGAPLRVVHPKEGAFTSAGSGCVYRMNKSPHPNAGAVFINWLLTNEGQTIASKAIGYPSRRVDVPTDFINPVFVRDPKVKYYDSDNLEYVLRQPEDIKKQAEIFGHLVTK